MNITVETRYSVVIGKSEDELKKSLDELKSAGRVSQVYAIEDQTFEVISKKNGTPLRKGEWVAYVNI